MPNLKATVGVLHDYGQRSTLHGLSHMYQSHDMWRKFFWLILTFMGCTACTYHIWATVRNYMESPITSTMTDEGAEATFPDVTICNLKPVAESVMKIDSHRQQLFKHFRNEWDFFDNWMPEERKRRLNETRVEYRVRARELFKTYMDIFWSSDDSRDLGLSDTHMLLSCTYNGLTCGTSDFKLVQHPATWNCYTFIPPYRELKIASDTYDSGLRLTLFTDSNFGQRVNETFRYKRTMYRQKEIETPYTLQQYLTEGGRTLNQVITGNRMEPEGMYVVVHLKDTVPGTASTYFTVANAASSTIEFGLTQSRTMNRPPDHICNPEEPKMIQYVKYFGNSSTKVGLKSFGMTQLEAVIEEKQRMIFEECGCYSHLYPFKYNTSVLCLFAPPGQRRQPSPSVLRRIRCHARISKAVERKTQELISKFSIYRSCEDWKLHVSKVSVPWPRKESLYDFINYIVLPKYYNQTDVRAHHILRGTRLSREKAVLDILFDPACRQNGTEDDRLLDSWCISPEKLISNLADIWVKPETNMATVYEETYSYDWPEALSEIGGVFGLWMGISLLSVFEFIELIFIILKTSKMPEKSERRPFGMGSPELEMILRQLLSQEEEAGWVATRGPVMAPAGVTGAPRPPV